MLGIAFQMVFLLQFLNMSEAYIESSWTKPDGTLRSSPPPAASIQISSGQESVCARLEIFIEAAKNRKEALGTLPFFWPARSWENNTWPHIIAKSMGTQLTVTSGPCYRKTGRSWPAFLTNLKWGDVLFIDEIHRLPKSAEEYLYSAMEDFSLDLMIDTGPNARSVQVKLNPFTLIGATTRSGFLALRCGPAFSFLFASTTTIQPL